MQISNSQLVMPNARAFKGKFERNENGNLYYKTNSAMKIGGTFAAFSALGLLIKLGADKFLNEELPLTSVKNKRNKAATIISGILTIAGHLGSAAIIDYKRNKKARETADYIKRVGTKQAIMTNENICVSNKGRAYYDSNIGAKYGWGLGMALGCINSIYGAWELKKSSKPLKKQEQKLLKKFSVAGMIFTIGFSTLGGWLLGKWSDSLANKDAQKHA